MTNEEKQPETDNENTINEQPEQSVQPTADAQETPAEAVETRSTSDLETEPDVQTIPGEATDEAVNLPETGDAVPEAEAVQQIPDEQIEDVARSVPPPDEYPEGQAEAAARDLPEDANAFEKSVTEAIEVSEQAQSNPVVQGFGSAVSAIQRAIESVGGERTTDHHDPATHGDKTYFLGKEYDIPIYTSVFMALGVLTVIEVLIAEIISGDIKIPILLGIAGAKALLVVLFYMHLNTDSRIFSVVLAVPVVLAILSVLFLVAIPSGY